LTDQENAAIMQRASVILRSPNKVTHAPQETQERFLSAIALRFVTGRDALRHISHQLISLSLISQLGLKKGTVKTAFHLGHPRILPEVRVGTNQGEN
jgi:hypothetical protein